MCKENKKLVAIMVLGQGSDHGLTVIKKPKSTDYPSELAWRTVRMMMKRNKPKDACAEIELDAELVKFSTALDYYNEMVAVTARFDVTRSETELIRMMAKKVSSSMFAKLIIEHLTQTANHHDLETLCNEIGEIQYLTKATGNTGQSGKGSGQ